MPLNTITYISQDRVRGMPFIDADGRRIWALSGIDGVYPSYHAQAIDYSDDYGDTWNTWVELDPTENKLYDTTSLTLFVDNRRNVYFTRRNRLYRVDAKTREEKRVVVFAARESFSKDITNVFLGHWTATQDLEDVVYIPQYGSNDNGGSVAFLWKSMDYGEHFERVDWVAGRPFVAHVHNCKCNPYDGFLYFSVGDGDRYLFLSRDKLVTEPIDLHFTAASGSKDAPLGFHFSPEGGLYLTCDLPNVADQGVYCWDWTKPDVFSFPQVFIPDPGYGEVAYWMVGYGDNELWYRPAVYEGQRHEGVIEKNALIKLTKSAGLSSPWMAEVITEDPGYGLACDRFGMLPETFPYVITSTLRVQRVE